jgi:hypothetical protein
MLKKWHRNALATNAINSFYKSWSKSNETGWHEGYADGIPKTNNAREATNNVIKKSGTFSLPMESTEQNCTKV